MSLEVMCLGILYGGNRKGETLTAMVLYSSRCTLGILVGGSRDICCK